MKLFFLSAGLGNVNRGFEISAATWFNHLKDHPGIEARLFSGGKWTGSTPVANFSRNGMFAGLLRRWGWINDGCRLEQVSFSFGLLPYLLTKKPDIIWLQEGTLAQWLLRFRKVFGFRYRVVFCDGAPLGERFASQFDAAIFLHDAAAKAALAAGLDASKILVQPHLVFQPLAQLPRQEARRQLGLPPRASVIICVAAWNKHHKRIDYLLRETRKLAGRQVVLLLCGQPEQETAALKQLAASLGLEVYWNTFTQAELSVAYRAADIFVLPSVSEGFGTVLIEAALHGLPIISHPHPGARYILGTDYEGLQDLTVPGRMATAMQTFLSADLPALGAATEARVRHRFDTQKSIENFVSFLRQLV